TEARGGEHIGVHHPFAHRRRCLGIDPLLEQVRDALARAVLAEQGRVGSVGSSVDSVMDLVVVLAIPGADTRLEEEISLGQIIAGVFLAGVVVRARFPAEEARLVLILPLSRPDVAPVELAGRRNAVVGAVRLVEAHRRAHGLAVGLDVGIQVPIDVGRAGPVLARSRAIGPVGAEMELRCIAADHVFVDVDRYGRPMDGEEPAGGQECNGKGAADGWHRGSSQIQCEWLSKRSEHQREHGACQGGKPRNPWVCRGSRLWASHSLVRGSRGNARRREGVSPLPRSSAPYGCCTTFTSSTPASTRLAVLASAASNWMRTVWPAKAVMLAVPVIQTASSLAVEPSSSSTVEVVVPITLARKKSAVEELVPWAK